MGILSNNNITKMCTILPDKWSTFMNVLKPLNTQGSINIVNSGIYQDINSGVATLVAQINNLVGEGITFDIMNPAKHVKLFKLLETSKDVDLLDDPDNEQFIATNGQIKIYLPKQIESISSEANKPDYTGLMQIGESIKIDKKTKKDIETFIKSENVDSIDLLIKDDQLVGFEVKNTGVYLFNDYSGMSGINSETADVVFKSLAFLVIDGDEFIVNVGKYPDDRHLLITEITTGYMSMSLNEELDLGSGDELDLI